MMRQFAHRGLPIKADNVAAVVQRNATCVEIRYSDGTKPIILTGTSSSAVLKKIDDAKADADSA